MSALPLGNQVPAYIQAILNGRPMTLPGNLPPNMGAKTTNMTGLTTTPSFQDRFSNAISSPLGQFGLNLLSQSGPSTVPRSLGQMVGQAGLRSLNSQNAQQIQDAQRRLIEAQIRRLEQPQQSNEPLTALAKLREDVNAGRISPEVFEAERRKVLDQGMQDRFGRAQALRGEFRKDTDSLQQSLQALSAARNLAATDNPTAQLASFISTIRSIDNSTVREGEMNAFNKIQSLTVELEQKFQRLREGGFSPTLRNDIDETITALEQPLSELLDKRKDFYRGEAERFNVEPDSVAGIPFSEVGEAQPPRTTGQAPAAPPITQTAQMSGVTPEEWEVMSEEDRRLFED